MRQLGLAEKMFGQLEANDHIYYIDPKMPTVIQFLVIKGTSKFEPKKGYIYVEYYKSSQALSMIDVDNKDSVPTGKILVKSTDTRVLTMSMPPTVYFTNKKALEKFMAGK